MPSVGSCWAFLGALCSQVLLMYHSWCRVIFAYPDKMGIDPLARLYNCMPSDSDEFGGYQ